MATPLRSSIVRFVRFKQGLGFKYRNFAGPLRALDHWLADRGVEEPAQVSTPLLGEWVTVRSRDVARSTLVRELSMLRLLFGFLHSRGNLPHNPAAALPKLRLAQYFPFVFSVEQLRSLLDCGVRIFRRPESRRLYYTLFHLLYATGMRVSEALHLRRADVDFQQRLLHVRRTKFFKKRLLPLGKRATMNLRRYLRHRRQAEAELPGGAYFFTASRGRNHSRPLSHAAVSQAFHWMLQHVGLDRPRRVIDGRVHAQPHVHSLRHSMAVHRLLKWYREHHDVNQKLLLLSTYLGHSHVGHTQAYLNLSNVVLAEANERVTDLLSEGEQR